MEISIRKAVMVIYSLYTFSFVTIFCSQLTYISSLNMLYIFVQKICIATLILLLIRSFLKKQMAQSLFFSLIVISIILFLTFYSNGGILDLIIVFTFIFSMKYVKFNEIIRLDLMIKLVALLVIILLSLIGVIDNNISYSSRGALRISLGFLHANILSLIVLNICFDWLYLRFYKLKWFEYLTLFLVISSLYFLTNSLTSVLSIIILVILNISYKVTKKVGLGFKGLNAFIFLIVPTAILFTMYVAINYSPNSRIFNLLNELSTGRVSSIYNFYNEYGISFFGQSIEMVSTTQANKLGVAPHVLDNGYMRLLLRFGIIPTFILLGMIISLNVKLLLNKNYALAICLSSYCMVGIMESSFYRVEYNPFLLAGSYIILKQNGYKVYNRKRYSNEYKLST